MSFDPEPEEAELLPCRWHPKVETALRCYECGVPICAKCVRRTPVGYICPDCVKGRRHRFEQATPRDYVVTAITALILGAASGVLPLYSLYLNWLMIFLSLGAGALIASVVWMLVQHRYSENLWWITCAGMAAGSLGGLVYFGGFYYTPLLLWWIVHTGLAISTAAARLRRL